jgi:hypothetical protein
MIRPKSLFEVDNETGANALEDLTESLKVRAIQPCAFFSVRVGQSSYFPSHISYT